MAAKKRAAPTDLASAIADTTSEAWRDFIASASADDLDRALDGVTWSQPRAYEPGFLVPNALFTGRGKTKKLLHYRSVVALAAAPSAGAASLRASVTSLGLEGDPDRPLDLAPLEAFVSLRWLQVKSAAALPGIDAVRNASRLDVERIATVDLTIMEGGRFEEAMIARSRIAGGVPRARKLRLIGVEGAVRASASELGIMADDGARALGPIDSDAEALDIYNSPSLRTIELGALPALRSLRLSCLNELETVSGLDRCAGLRRASLYLVGMTTLPTFPDTLEELDVETSLDDAASLASLVRLRKLRLASWTAPSGLPPVIARMEHLEHLSVRSTPLDELLPVLGQLPALRSLALRNYPFERVPELDRLVPQVEVLSLEDCRGGFMEHDALHRMPNLRQLRLAGSTLDMFKKQLDRRIRERGVEVRFDR